MPQAESVGADVAGGPEVRHGLPRSRRVALSYYNYHKYLYYHTYYYNYTNKTYCYYHHYHYGLPRSRRVALSDPSRLL